MQRNYSVSLNISLVDGNRNEAIVVASEARLTRNTWNFFVISFAFKSAETIDVFGYIDGKQILCKHIEENPSICQHWREKFLASEWYFGSQTANSCIVKGFCEDLRIFSSSIDVDASIRSDVCAEKFVLSCQKSLPVDLLYAQLLFKQLGPVIRSLVTKISGLDVKLRDATGEDREMLLKVLMRYFPCLNLLCRSDYFSSYMVSPQSNGKHPLSMLLDVAERGSEFLRMLTSNETEPNSIVVESDHPYQNNMEGVVKEISFEESDEKGTGMKIWFDPRSCSENNYDYVSFHSSSDKTPASRIGAEKYTGGRDGSAKNYPTEAAPLFVPGRKVYVAMFSDGSNNDWGWKIYATMCEIPVFKEVVLSDDCIMIESSHPYASNEDSYRKVEISNAKKLEIFFSEDTATELNYDYVRIFKDDSHNEFWGAEKYSGGRGGTVKNFPTQSNPLIIPTNSFVLHFKSDGR